MSDVKLSQFSHLLGEEEQTLKRDPKTDSLYFDEEASASSQLTEDIVFNKESGALTIIKADSSTITVTGFLTKNHLGQGLRGEKGPSGKNGKDGRVGRDGATGDTGCPGETGPTGEKGFTGSDGQDGDIGISGAHGCPGAIGARGDDGAAGATGPQGAQGPAGPACIVGEKGPIGESPYEYCYISDEEPTSSMYSIWGQPTQGSVRPPSEDYLASIVSQYTSNLVRYTGDSSLNLYSASQTYTVDVSGGTGPFTYEWSLDNADLDSEYDGSELTLSADGKSITLAQMVSGSKLVVSTDTVSAQMSLTAQSDMTSGHSYELSADFTVTVYDEGTGQRTSIRAFPGGVENADNRSTTSNFVGTVTYIEPNVTPPTNDGGNYDGSSGGGCVAYGSKVRLLDGREVPIESIVVGDTLVGCGVAGMPDSSSHTDSELYRQWDTKDLVASTAGVTVTDVRHSYYHSYYLINGTLSVTYEHPILAKRDNVWSWLNAEHVQEGDYVQSFDGETKVISIQYLEESIRTVDLDVEFHDTYFVEGILLHNSEQYYDKR